MQHFYFTFSIVDTDNEDLLTLSVPFHFSSCLKSPGDSDRYFHLAMRS